MNKSESNHTTPAIVIHGGAWAIPDTLLEASCVGVQNAARAGYRVLEGEGSALDAVQAAVRVLEDDPAFDAGEFKDLLKHSLDKKYPFCQTNIALI